MAMSPAEWMASQKAPEPTTATSPSPQQWMDTNKSVSPSPSEWLKSKQPQEEQKPWYSEGYLSRIAAATAEKVASIGMSDKEKEAYQKYYPHAPDAPTAGVADSLKYLGNQIVEHPLDAIAGLAKGIGSDPELLFPALWEALPAKLAAVVKAGGAAAKVAETTARGAAIGATAEATAGYSEGKMDPQKVANTAVMFGVMGGVTRGAIEGGTKAWEASKGAVIQKAPVKSPLDEKFQQSKMRPNETVSDVMARKAEGKHLAQAAFKNKETGEIVPQGAKHDDILKAQNSDGTTGDGTKHTTEGPDSKYAQGFIDGDGNFLNRHEALARAHETKQLPRGTLPTNGKSINIHNLGQPTTLSHDTGPLAKSDGKNISLNTPAIEQDFKAGFKYIFDPSTPTGKQKEIVFNRLGITKEQFSKIINTPEKYKQFLIEHEQSHLDNNDKAVYPRTKEGKIDLFNPKAIEIETRATSDGLKKVQNSQLDFPEEGLHSGDLRKAGDPNFQTATPPEHLQEIADAAMNKVDAEVEADMRKDWEKNNTVLTHAANVIGTAMAHIRALTRRATIYGKSLKDLIPDAGQRDRVTRALEAEKYYDKIYTDAGKASALSSMQNGLRKISNEIYTLEQDAKTDPKVLADKVDQFNRLKFSHDKWAAQPSEEHLIPILKRVQDRLKEIGDQAKAAGLIEQLRDNYVTHILDFSKSKLDVKEHQALLDKIFNAPKDSKLVKDFTEARKYDYLRTLEEAVAGTGVVVHTDIATIAEAYEKSMLTAIVHKKMIDHFLSEKAPNGKGYIEKLTPEILAEGYKVFQGKGSRPLLGLAVHPDVADAMGHMFQLTDPDMLLRALGSVSMLTKTINTVASLFHATNLGIAAMTADPALMVKEILTGGSGIRAAAKAFKTDENHALINLLMDNGFMAGSEDVQRTIVHDLGVKTDQLLSKFAPADSNVKLVQYITEPFDKQILQRVNAFTWDYMHTGSKLNLAINRFNKMKLKNPDMPDAEIAKEVSRFVNNTFGGLNWIDVANQTNNYYLKAFAMRASGMKGRAWGQVMLFAPDWTVSTLRSFTTALPQKFSDMHPVEGLKGMWNPKTQGDFARRYVLNTAIGYMTIQNAINIATSGHPIWENKDPTRVDLGDGTSMQVAKHSMEVAEWVRNPSKTLGNKLGFIPKLVYIEVSGRAYPGPDAPKIKPLYDGYGGEEVGKARAIVLQISPFQLSAGAQAPEGEGMKRAIASALGVPTYGMTHADRKAAIAKGRAEAKAKREKKKYDFSSQGE